MEEQSPFVENKESKSSLKFLDENPNSIKFGLLVVVLILLLIIVSSGGLSGVGTWFAAIFARIFTTAHLGLTFYTYSKK